MGAAHYPGSGEELGEVEGGNVRVGGNGVEDAVGRGLLNLTKRDRGVALGMLGREGLDEEWKREVRVMLMLGVKAEIQVLSERIGGLERWLDGKLADG